MKRLLEFLDRHAPPLVYGWLVLSLGSAILLNVVCNGG